MSVYRPRRYSVRVLLSWPLLERLLSTISRANHSPKPRVPLQFDRLENRILPSGYTGYSAPNASWLTPAAVSQAYRFNQIASFNGATPNGSGQTIAILGFDDNPNVIPSVLSNGTTNSAYLSGNSGYGSDVHNFDAKYGLNDFNAGNWFKKVLLDGLTPGSVRYPFSQYPNQPFNHAAETALDVEWAHAMAPGANILLIEIPVVNPITFTDSLHNILDATAFAAQQPGVSVFTMSYGWPQNQAAAQGGESYLEANHAFQTPSTHQGGITYIAATGDNGLYQYPAASPNVLGIGGTTLALGTNNNWSSESYWSTTQNSGGGGDSSQLGTLKPSYQQAFQSSNSREGPDVSYNAGGPTASYYSVYDSYNFGYSIPWSPYAGTSAGTPQWAALIAIADQGRAAAGLATLDGATQTLPAIYNLPSSDFHVIATGGFDTKTGRGSPLADKVVADLVSAGTVAAYSFDNSSHGNDDSGGGNTLTAYGNAAFTLNGQNKSAAQFDGTTNTYLKTSSAINLNNKGLTVEAWVNMASVSGLQGIVAESETTTYNGYGFGLYVSGGHIGYYFNDGNFTNTSSATITAGSWHFLALTYKPGAPSNIALYIDNASTPAQTWNWATSPALIADSYLYVGSDAYGHLMNGMVDEVRVYNGYQPSAQIAIDKAVYLIPVTPAPSPSVQVAFFSFNDSTNVGRDDSGNGNLLTLSGAAAFTANGEGTTGAVRLNGTANTYLKTSSAINLNNKGLTVEAWVNMASVSGLQGIVAESETTTYNGYGFGLYVSGGHIGYYFNDGNFTNTSSATITAGSWHFLALTYKPGAPSNIALYIDNASTPAQTWNWATSPALIADSYLYRPYIPRKSEVNFHNLLICRDLRPIVFVRTNTVISDR